jgi:hypothetical protein
MHYVGWDGSPIGDPQGPPTFITLLKEWLREDPTLRPHFYLVGWEDGTYIQTRCNNSLQQKLEHGYALACVQNEGHEIRKHPNTVSIFYHGDEPRVRGYLRKEDPLFFDKLRSFLILGHDGLYEATNCKIKYEFIETLPDREAAIRQKWWEDGKDL